jgi:hypothetical protein
MHTNLTARVFACLEQNIYLTHIKIGNQHIKSDRINVENGIKLGFLLE